MKNIKILSILSGILLILNMPAFAGYDDFTVNIPNSQGGYTAVVLKRSGNGYTGPQGEYYTQFPSVTQLQAMYGANTGLQQINAPAPDVVAQQQTPTPEDQEPVEIAQPYQVIYQPPPEYRHEEEYADQPHYQPTFVEAAPAEDPNNYESVISLFNFKKKKESNQKQSNKQRSDQSQNNNNLDHEHHNAPANAPVSAPANTPAQEDPTHHRNKPDPSNNQSNQPNTAK